MKKCPYCAELIQDEAIKCRYCGSDLTPSPGVLPSGSGSGERRAEDPSAVAAQPPMVPAPGPRVGEGAIRFSHSGYRYILGFGTDLFGIWDREAPGGPAMRFPRSDEGWAAAWNRFSALEPRAMAVETTARPASATSSRSPASTAGLAGWLVGLLVALIPLTLIEAAFVAHRLVLLGRIRTESGQVSAAQASAADARVFAMSRVTGAVGLAIVVLWLIWQFRSHKNLPTLGVAGLRYSPGLVVAFWLIPFTFPVMPYLTMRELWKASEPSTGATDWKMVRTSGLLPLWWLTFLAQIVLGAVAAGFAADQIDTVSSAITSNSLSLAALLINAVAAGLAALLVRRVQGRMSAKRERVTLWQGTPTHTG